MVLEDFLEEEGPSNCGGYTQEQQTSAKARGGAACGVFVVQGGSRLKGRQTTSTRVAGASSKGPGQGAESQVVG